jgi:urea transport system ATP-binding protein
MLKLEGIHQYYGGSHILRGIDLDVPAGKITTVLGRNGVGKTTLLKTIGGVVPAKSGKVMFDGKDITTLPSYQRAALGIAYVPQGREIFPRLTVHENLLMGLAPLPASARLPSSLFELFPVLNTMLQRKGGDLSGGQQQQLAIARALASNPKLLILDEPTEGIQPSIIKDIGRVIRLLATEQRMTVLLVEQYYDFARDLADHYCVLARGQVVASGLGAKMEDDKVRDLVTI